MLSYAVDQQQKQQEKDKHDRLLARSPRAAGNRLRLGATFGAGGGGVSPNRSPNSRMLAQQREDSNSRMLAQQREDSRMLAQRATSSSGIMSGRAGGASGVGAGDGRGIGTIERRDPNYSLPGGGARSAEDVDALLREVQAAVELEER